MKKMIAQLQNTLGCLATIGLLAAGCATTTRRVDPPPPGSNSPTELTLSEGDSIKIDVPGNERLGGEQMIRRDGKISLRATGDATITDIQAAGKTPAELEKELIRIYGEQLVTKDISIIVLRSEIAVFVEGAVPKAGKIPSLKPITALDAIMEAGGFIPNRSNMKEVIVIRKEGTATKSYVLNLEPAFRGLSVPTFYLKSGDIVSVKERILW